MLPFDTLSDHSPPPPPPSEAVLAVLCGAPGAKAWVGVSMGTVKVGVASKRAQSGTLVSLRMVRPFTVASLSSQSSAMAMGEFPVALLERRRHSSGTSLCFSPAGGFAGKFDDDRGHFHVTDGVLVGSFPLCAVARFCLRVHLPSQSWDSSSHLHFGDCVSPIPFLGSVMMWTCVLFDPSTTFRGSSFAAAAFSPVVIL